MYHATPERDLIRQKLVDLLSATPIGQILRYDRIKAVTDLRTEQVRPLIYKAMREVNKAHGAVFLNVREEGYKRAPNGEVHVLGENARRSIRGKSRRTAKALSSAVSKTNDLDREQRNRIHSEIATLGLVELSAGRAGMAAASKLVPETLDLRSRPPTATETAKALLETLQSR